MTVEDVKAFASFRQSEFKATRTTTPVSSALKAQATLAPAMTNITASNMSASQLTAAEALIGEVRDAQNKYNAYRVANPRRNDNGSGSTPDSQKFGKRDASVPIPVLNSTVKEALVLIGERDARAKAANGTLYRDYTRMYPPNYQVPPNAKDKRSTSTWWMPNVDHSYGTWPYGSNSSYQVWRNVSTYGAPGNGQHDDTAAIQAAIADGNRCGAGCNTSSVTGAVVYFPPGTYLISSPIQIYFNTQLIGDAVTLPTLLASTTFTGLGMLSTDFYDGSDGGNGEWYINQANFLRQIRNFNLDITDCPAYQCTSIHYQVAQGTSLQNLNIYASTASGTTQQGIFSENGSGGWMEDLYFSGGDVGLYCGNQQFTVSELFFTGANTAINIIWDWGWTWSKIVIYDCGVGISLIGVGGYRGTGSLYLLGSSLSATSSDILSAVPVAVGSGVTQITVDNCLLESGIKDTSGNVILAGSTSVVDFFTLGRVYDPQHPNGTFTFGETPPLRPKTPSLRNSVDEFFSQLKPQYETTNADTFFNMGWVLTNDGATDNTALINGWFPLAVEAGYYIYFPAGS